MYVHERANATFSDEGARRESFFQEIIRENATVILSHQDLTSGLFPAATVQRRVEKGHYGHAWIRDTSAIVKGLLYSMRTTDDSRLRDDLGAASVRSIVGILEIAGRSTWQKGFGQLIADEGTYTHLTEEAPPIHLTLDGEVCPWPRQNQPDSWGAFLTVVGHAWEQRLFEPDKNQRAVLASIASYLANIRAEKFESSSMWEDREVRNPPSVSTALIVEEGLKRLKPLFLDDGSFYEHELARIIDRRVNAIDTFIEERYPEDLTWIEGHQSRTDLATLVAFGYGDYGRLPVSQYLRQANQELGSGDLPGKIRFIGDPYYKNEGKEAVWRMALPLEAIVLFRFALRAAKAGNFADAQSYKHMADARMEKTIKSAQEIGYEAELMYWDNGKLVPNGNDLLWQRSLVMDAAAMAFEASKI